GLFADCYPDGQLRHLGFYSEGSCDGSWALYLEHGVAQGKAILVLGLGGTPDYEIYKDGTAERFDPWSDNSPAYPVPYRKWVEGWIGSLAGPVRRQAKGEAGAARSREAAARLGMRKILKVIK